MSSLNALKYKIVVNSSNYAAVVVFLLYFFVILLSLLVISLTLISFSVYLILFLITVYAFKISFLGQGQLLLSESGLIERTVNDKKVNGKIGHHSFYNGFFIFLQLQVVDTLFADKNGKQFMIIYRDAITDKQYRLLARLINSGRS